MTNKFIGKFGFENETIVKEVSEQPIPAKQDWNQYAIWEFNGKRYRPVTEKAVQDLEILVKQLETAGYKNAIKPGKRKPSSLKYAICTLGVENFTLCK